MLGEVLAEEVIRALSRSPNMDVISRLSTTAFRGRLFSFEDIDQHLRANYVLVWDLSHGRGWPRADFGAGGDQIATHRVDGSFQ